MKMYSDIFEVAEPTVIVSPIYAEIDSIVVALDLDAYTDDFNVSNPVVWNDTVLFSETAPVLALDSTGLTVDYFEWLPEITTDSLFTEEYTAPTVDWNSIFTDDSEKFSPEKYISLVDGISVIDIPWGALYSDIVTLNVPWESLFVDNTNEFSLWRDYARVMDNGYLPRDLFSPLIIPAPDAFEAPPVTWDEFYVEMTNIYPNWYALYTDRVEWSTMVCDTTPFFAEGGEWEPSRDSIFLYTDGFAYSKPVISELFLFSDTLEWDTILGWTLILTDNLETDFIPYAYHPDETGYLPRSLWQDITTYQDTFEPTLTVQWAETIMYSDAFNQTEPSFETITMYSEGWEWVAKLQYNLAGDYEFELVFWTDTAMYTEDWESELSKLEYFDPFEETFEWAPLSLSYNDLPDLEENVELGLAWDSLYVDDFEAA